MEPLRSTDPARIAEHRLLGRLGAGGMGVVYLARSPGGGLVALKVLLAEYAEEREFKDRFRREVEAARRISSPWAVPVVDADTETGAPWLASTYVPGPSLSQTVATHGPLSEQGVRLLGGRLAEALSAMHRTGLVHRDLKPGNVLLAHDGPRLIDFGIARAPEDTALTATGWIVGTPGYLSPEQAGAYEGGRVGPPADVFALGCVLAFAATGRPPFGSGQVDALLYRVIHDEADLDGIPDSVLAVVRRCLEKEPAGRPAADELAAELTAEGGPVADAEAGWLPAGVTRLIAERSAAALALVDIDDTQVSVDSHDEQVSPAAGPDNPVSGPEPRDADEVRDPPPGERGPGRRRFLTLTGGAAVLAAGGSTGLWALTRDDSRAAAAAKPDRTTYTIAVQGDLSGADRETGRAQERGVRLAVEEFDAGRGRAYDLRVRAVDDKGDPARAGRVAAELAADSAVLGVVGPTTDATAEASLPAYDAGLLPVVAVSPGATQLGVGGYRSFLHARVPDTLLAFYLDAYVRGPGRSRKVGIVDDLAADAYAQEISGTLSTILRDAKQPFVPKVVSSLRADFGPAVDALLGEGADSVVFAGPRDRAALIARTLRQRNFPGAKASGTALLDPRFLSEAAEAAEGWVIAAPVVDASVKPEARGFADAYRKRYGGAPPRYAAEAYDAARILLRPLSTLPAGRRTREDLLAAVRAAKHQGVTRTFEFQEKSPSQLVIDGTGVSLWRVEKGRFVYSGPAPFTV